jgi:hypothetical protein
MSLDEVASQLWAEHLRAPFPARPPGELIVGVDLVMLDADVAGCVQTWMGNNFRLDEPNRGWLARCLSDLDRVLPVMDDPAERDYFERLRRLARLALT